MTKQKLDIKRLNGVVSYSIVQTLTDLEKQQARENIGAGIPLSLSFGLSFDNNDNVRLGTSPFSGSTLINLSEWQDNGYSDLTIADNDSKLFFQLYNDGNENDRGLYFYALSDNNLSELSVGLNSVYLSRAIDVSDEIKTQLIFFDDVLNNHKILIRDDINEKGLENNGDYEVNFTARSLVTKQYVDNLIFGAGAGLSIDDNGYIQLGVKESDGSRTIDLSEWGEDGEAALLIRGLNEDSFYHFWDYGTGVFHWHNSSNGNKSSSNFIEATETEAINVTSVRLNESITRLFLNTEDFAGFEDQIHEFGLRYNSNYFDNGSQNDRWIPDWGAVKNYVTNTTPQTDGVTVKGTITQDGNDLTLNNAWRWRINNVVYGPAGNTTLNFPATTAGFHRIDLIVGNTSGVITRVAGTEVAVEDPVFAPTAPTSTVPLAEVFVLETGLSSFAEFALASFVRYDINNQGLSPVQRQNARTNIQAVSRDTNDSRIGDLFQNGELRISNNSPSYTISGQHTLRIFGREASAATPRVISLISGNTGSQMEIFRVQNRGDFYFNNYNSGSVSYNFRIQKNSSDIFTSGTTNAGHPAGDNTLHVHTRISCENRSNILSGLVRRDELHLNYSQTVADTGTINNLAINADTKLLILTGADDLTGVVGEAGRLLRVEARGAQRIIRHDSGSSAAANRFSNPQSVDIVIPSGAVYTFFYTNSRWRLISTDVTREWVGTQLTEYLGNITTSVPANSTSTGVKGTVAYDSNFLYLCVATNQWIRASIDLLF